MYRAYRAIRSVLWTIFALAIIFSAICLGFSLKTIPSDEPVPDRPILLQKNTNVTFSINWDRKGRRQATLGQDLFFCDNRKARVMRVARNYVTDFASFPRPLSYVISNQGRYSEPAIVHDYLYSIGEERDESGRLAADNDFYAAMTQARVLWPVRRVMHGAVRVGGRDSYGAAREWRFAESYLSIGELPKACIPEKAELSRMIEADCTEGEISLTGPRYSTSLLWKEAYTRDDCVREISDRVSANYIEIEKKRGRNLPDILDRFRFDSDPMDAESTIDAIVYYRNRFDLYMDELLQNRCSSFDELLIANTHEQLLYPPASGDFFALLAALERAAPGTSSSELRITAFNVKLDEFKRLEADRLKAFHGPNSTIAEEKSRAIEALRDQTAPPLRERTLEERAEALKDLEIPQDDNQASLRWSPENAFSLESNVTLDPLQALGRIVDFSFQQAITGFDPIKQCGRHELNFEKYLTPRN